MPNTEAHVVSHKQTQTHRNGCEVDTNSDHMILATTHTRARRSVYAACANCSPLNRLFWRRRTPFSIFTQSQRRRWHFSSNFRRLNWCFCFLKSIFKCPNAAFVCCFDVYWYVMGWQLRISGRERAREEQRNKFSSILRSKIVVSTFKLLAIDVSMGYWRALNESLSIQKNYRFTYIRQFQFQFKIKNNPCLKL